MTETHLLKKLRTRALTRSLGPCERIREVEFSSKLAIKWPSWNPKISCGFGRWSKVFSKNSSSGTVWTGPFPKTREVDDDLDLDFGYLYWRLYSYAWCTLTSGLSLSRSVPVCSNRHSVTLTGTHRNFRPCQLALEWQIHLSIPQNSYQMPLLQLNSVLESIFL